jgi:hypothetical protein
MGRLAVLLVSLPAVSGFLSRAAWSRINSNLRVFGTGAERAAAPLGESLFGPRRCMGSPSALWATASYGAGDFGDEISSSELREQLSVFESQLANAMNRGERAEGLGVGAARLGAGVAAGAWLR